MDNVALSIHICYTGHMNVREAGKKGGDKRTKNMTAEQRSASARKAVLARWAKHRANKKLEKQNGQVPN